MKNNNSINYRTYMQGKKRGSLEYIIHNLVGRITRGNYTISKERLLYLTRDFYAINNFFVYENKETFDVPLAIMQVTEISNNLRVKFYDEKIELETELERRQDAIRYL